MLRIALLNGKPEIFHSIQGEGKNIGRPSIFIRLSLCNLYCYWCDTEYTWNWENTPFVHQNDSKANYQKFSQKENIITLSEEAIIQEITQYPCQNLIFTGGEPLIQQKQLIPLLEKLRNINPCYQIEFETNGTIMPSPKLDELTHQYNVSVKLANSRVTIPTRLKENVISFFAQNPKAYFKFVIEAPQDVQEVLTITENHRIPHERIYLMPQGTQPNTLKKKQQWLIEICKKHNFHYTDRLHILIYGNKRGV